jgi:hypothetical protein
MEAKHACHNLKTTAVRNIPGKFVIALFLLLFSGVLYGQSHLIPVNAPANKYPITFTDIGQQNLILEFSATVTAPGTSTGWTITVGGVPVPMVGNPSSIGSLLRISLSSPISYTDRNAVRVSYNGTGGLTLFGGLLPVISNVQAFNNYIAVAADFSNGLYGEIPPIDICATVENVQVEYNITVTARYRNSIHFSIPIALIQWQYPAVTPVVYPVFSEQGLGTGLFRAVSNYVAYPSNTVNCTWDISMYPHIYNSGTLQPDLYITQRRVIITIPNYKRDNGTPVPGTGDLGLDPPIDDPTTLFCVGDDITAFTFDDATVFDCQLDVSPILPNINPRYVQFVYGTHVGNGIPNVFIDVNGTMVQVTDNNGNVILGPFSVDANGNPTTPYMTVQGFEGPVTQYIWDNVTRTRVTPLATTYPIHHAGDFVNDVAGDIFDVTLRNWGPCNPYDAGDPFTYVNAVTEISRLRLIASPPLPTALDRTICLTDVTTLTAVRNGAPNPGQLYWYSNATLTTQVGVGTTYTPTITLPGVYTYYVREIAGTTGNCPGPVEAVVLNVREAIPQPGLISGPTEVCVNATNVVFSVPDNPDAMPIGGPTEYVWTLPVGWTFVGAQNGREITVNIAGATGSRTLSVARRYTTAPQCPGTARTLNVTVSPLTVGGSVTPNRTVCEGSNSGLLTLGSHTGSVVRWQVSSNGGGAWTNIAHTGTTYTSGALNTPGTYWYRAEVRSGSCTSAYSNHAVITVSSTSVGGTLSRRQHAYLSRVGYR